MKKRKDIAKYKHSAGPESVLSMRRGRTMEDRKKVASKYACREKQASLSMQTPLSCYVCEKQIKKNVGTYIGKNTYRHKHCAPGTAKWLKSNISKQSDLKEYFEKNYVKGECND